ncbi:ribulose-phosphate 3-epimerase [Micrococcoides hystricis]|uniref:Ribulose-phosphate 3-epimerase n=1 Tax=Micrococcoides hystricis TaxID=1572761 RepID=A0ABV6P768_9MICC
MKTFIHPSILSADFARLGEELQRIPDADAVHVDVMDNHFVPNLSFGMPIMEAVKANTDLPLDVHLMIEDPDRWALQYADAGADTVSFHVEAAQAPIRLARELRDRGVKAGLALRPATPVEPYLELLPEFDMLLIMTVEPGFGGQSFLDVMMPKVRTAREYIDAEQLPVRIEVDGGINAATIGTAFKAGADVFVAGSAVYSAAEPNQVIKDLQAALS